MKVLVFFVLIGIGIILSLINNFSSSKDSVTKNEEMLFQNLSQITTKNKVLQIDLGTAIFYETGRKFGGVNFLINQIDKATEDEETKGIFIRANSPGGAVVASQELYESLKRFQKTGKPIITSVMNLCASGCYYAVLPSAKIIANRGSMVGSIGVIMSSPNVEELAKKLGIKMNNITSAEYKDILSPFRKMKPYEEQHLRNIIGKLHDDFVADVIEWREDKSSANKLRKTANGLIYTSDQSLERGLIDEIGDVKFAKEKMAESLDVPLEDITFVKPSYQYWQDVLGIQISSFVDTLFVYVKDWWKTTEAESSVPNFHY